LLKVWKVLLLQFHLSEFQVYGRNRNDLTANITEVSINAYEFENFNILGYNLQAGALATPPMVMEPTSPLHFNDGLHIKLVLTACQHLKINVTFVEVKGPKSRVTVIDGSYQGIFRLLHRQEIDIAIADSVIVFSRFSAAIPLPSGYQLESVWCAPKKFNVAEIKILTGALSCRTWFSLIISFACIILVFYFKNRTSYSMELIVFTIFAISLQRCMQPPDKFFLPYRLLFGAVLLFFLMTSTCFLSGLLTLVKVPPLPTQVATIQEAYDEGLVFYFGAFAIQWINKSDHDLWNKILQPGKHVFQENYTNNLEHVVNKNGIVLSTAFSCKFRANEVALFGDKLIHILHGNFYVLPTSVFLSPANPLEPYFTDAFYHLIEAGFPNQWQESIAHRIKIKLNNKLKSSGSVQSVDVALSFNQLFIFFEIHIVLLTLSLVIFVIEIFYDR